MASKTIAWADQSGDVITMTAPAWSGSQTVTLSTPENFGIARELNIVFYSESNPAVSATLNVKQAEATLALSETSLVFASDDTSEKTVTVTTNMSTLDGAQLTLEGDTASDFTLSELSALSNGQATFTIKPNSANSSQDPRNVTIKLIAGRLATLSLPVTQDANAIQSVTYKNYRLQSPEYLYNGNSFNSETVIAASSGTLVIKGVPVRDKVTTYASGSTETVTEEVPSSDPLYLTWDIESTDGFNRAEELKVQTSVDEIKNGHYASIPSCGFILSAQVGGEFYLAISPDTSSLKLDLVFDGFTIQENKRETYDDFGSLTAPAVTCGKDKGSLGYGTAQVMAVCHYTSGSTIRENVPLSFSILKGGLYFKLIAQSPGKPGVIPSESTFTVETLQDNTGMSVRVGLVDVVANGNKIGSVSLQQTGATPWGDLLITNADFIAVPVTFEIRIGATTKSMTDLGSDGWELFPADPSERYLMIKRDALIEYWYNDFMSSAMSIPVTVTWGAPYNKRYFGELSKADRDSILFGTSVTCNVESFGANIT